MQEEFALHDLAVEDAQYGHQRPKIEEYGDQLFAVMHLLEMGYDGELSRGEVDVFVGRDFVLSVRSGSKRSEEHTSELQSLMRISYAVFCLKKKRQDMTANNDNSDHFRAK